MGSQITPILTSTEIDRKIIKNKVLAVDALNIIYQFLTTLKMRDGTPLKDSKGNITSHLNGLFLRTTKLMKDGAKLIFVFDGVSPELKQKEKERRRDAKELAKAKYKEALKNDDVEAMRKYAHSQTSLTKEMIEESKELLEALGVAIVQAPSEGEAQAAYIVNNGDADYVVSQDADAILFGAPNVIRNLTISEKKKKANSLAYETVKPIMFNLTENLNTLGIDKDQLIVLAMLVGTDFNVGGIKGIGPKKAVKLIHEYKDDINALFKFLSWETYFDYPWTDVFYLFKNIPVEKNYNFEFGKLDEEKVIEILCERHDFNKERVFNELGRIKKEKLAKEQKGLSDFF